jgi:hypothetical protein
MYLYICNIRIIPRYAFKSRLKFYNSGFLFGKPELDRTFGQMSEQGSSPDVVIPTGECSERGGICFPDSEIGVDDNRFYLPHKLVIHNRSRQWTLFVLGRFRRGFLSFFFFLFCLRAF